MTLGGHRLGRTLAWLLVTFLVLFPKGGGRLGSIPVTWGYLLLALSAPPLLLYRILFLPLRTNIWGAAALASTLPFQAIFIYSYFANGLLQLDFAVSTAVSFFVLPFLFLELYPQFYFQLDAERFRRHLCDCIFLTACFGIFLFFSRPITGHLIEIPFLTVNIADYGQIERTKHIARGGFLKLISTYNNGNVYGVAMMLLLPLYVVLEPRRWRHNLLRGALLLTLSRTVWAGLLAEQALAFASPLLATAKVFPRLVLEGTGRRLAIIFGIIVCILLAMAMSAYQLSFLLDPTLGGRIGEITQTSGATLLPTQPLQSFAEVLFASALTNYGYVGLFTILLIFFFPFLLVAARPEILQDKVRRAAVKGLLLYVIVSLSDGATNLIPVMAFYWFVFSVLIYGLPGAGLGKARPGRALPVRLPNARIAEESGARWEHAGANAG